MIQENDFKAPLAQLLGEAFGALDTDSGYVMDNGERLRTDWAAAWQQRTVIAAEWTQLRADLRVRYEDVIKRLHARSDWAGQVAGAWMTLLAHVAYHVGEIRQMKTSLTAGA
jgi:hypothetical protein